jgi:hypothetical protein
MDLNTHTKKNQKVEERKKTCESVWIEHHTTK